jgi:hypothetical protein
MGRKTHGSIRIQEGEPISGVMEKSGHNLLRSEQPLCGPHAAEAGLGYGKAIRAGKGRRIEAVPAVHAGAARSSVR